MRPTPATGQKAGSMPQQIDDMDVIALGLGDAAREGRQISDSIARMIATQWAGPDAITSFSTTGRIDAQALREEITVELIPYAKGSLPHRALIALDAYVEVQGGRPAIPGWSALWGR